MGDCIRPLLPGIRNTSYCKRIQGKLNREQRQPTLHHQQQQQQPQTSQQQQHQTYFQPNYTLGSVGSGLGAGGGLATGQQGLSGIHGHIHPLMGNSESGLNSNASTPSPFVGNVAHYNFSTTFSNP